MKKCNQQFGIVAIDHNTKAIVGTNIGMHSE